MRGGGCVFGAVRYQVSGEPYGGAVCHCRTCQQVHGAPMVAFFSVRRAGFSITGVLGEVRTSDHAVRRFCRACGTHMVFDDSRYPDEIDIATATLDDPAAVPPQRHIWTRSQVPWIKLGDGLPTFAERSDA